MRELTNFDPLVVAPPLPPPPPLFEPAPVFPARSALLWPANELHLIKRNLQTSRPNVPT